MQKKYIKLLKIKYKEVGSTIKLWVDVLEKTEH